MGSTILPSQTEHQFRVEPSRKMTMWLLLLVIPAMSAAPQLKYVESAIHFDPKAGNDTTTINKQEKAAALNSIYHNPAQLGHDHVDHADHADHAEDDDCCCSLPVQSSPGLRIVNRPPPTNEGHYQHQHHHHHEQKTCQPLVCCQRKSKQVKEALVAVNALNKQFALCQLQAKVQKEQLTQMGRSLAAYQDEVARYRLLVNQLERENKQLHREKKELLTAASYPAAIRKPNSV